MNNTVFVSEKKDYSISEFHDRFHSCLPKIVEVNQGVCSETGEETFGKGEVLVIAAISRQTRVVTKFQINQKSRLLSIPETYSEKLCVVKKGIPGREDLLVNILAHNKLPITVCFPRNRTISVRDKRLNTNNIPHLQLSETFHEVSLLGNYINNGELCEDFVPVPLYLSQLRVSIVTGIKDQSVEKWKHYKRDLYRKCSMIQYDRDFGSQDIAEYDPSAAHSGKALTYLEPKTYENIVNLVQSNESHFPDMTPEEVDELGLYEDVQVDHSEKHRPDIYYNQPENRNPLKKDLKKNFPRTAIQTPQATAVIQQIQSSTPALKPMSNAPGARPPIAPKPVLNPSKQELPSNVGNECAPALPARKSSYYRKTKAKPQSVSDPKYTNVLPTSSVAPTMSLRTTKTKVQTPDISFPEKAETKSDKPSRTVNSKEDVAKLSVEDVCEYLKLLNLKKYSDSFRDHMIDGALLQSLGEDLFIEEMGMKKIEVIRLMKFSKEGRLPVLS